MDRISRRSQGPEGVRFGNHRISSLLFADDVVLMASSGQDLQHVLERFAAECEAAGMRISTSKQIRGHGSRPEKGGSALSRWVERSCLKWRSSSISGSCSRVRERERSEREIDRRMDWCSAVRSYAVGVPDRRGEEGAESKGEALDLPVNLRSHLTYGHELWVMTERTRSRIQAAEMSFLRRVAGRSLRDRGEKLGHSGGARSRAAAPSHREESAEVAWASVFGCPLDASLGRCSRHVPPGGGLGEDPGHAGETMSLGWPGNASGPPGRAGGSVWGEGSLGISAQTAASATRSRTKRMKKMKKMKMKMFWLYMTD
ncbi:hypothetical protein L3Q82_000352 [Scortum barcoo]|uniref:Uncharacterized protein n=1 Tax=Scortum barcoo TaxID=214431 RepID=A0ACB8XAJ8_9TELE|nr:hypothetical protein L3Q82_000352 [Scortum barcoo]